VAVYEWQFAVGSGSLYFAEKPKSMPASNAEFVKALRTMLCYYTYLGLSTRSAGSREMCNVIMKLVSSLLQSSFES
jgi:hypothetical protein